MHSDRHQLNKAHYERNTPHAGADQGLSAQFAQTHLTADNNATDGRPATLDSRPSDAPSAADYGQENDDVLEHDKVMGEGKALPPKPRTHPCLIPQGYEGTPRGVEVPEVTMEPWLQYMCTPLVSYYTVENGKWYGAVMVVTFDKGSIYSPYPYLTLQSDVSKYSRMPALGGGETGNREWNVQAEPYHTYNGPQGGSTFWRFMLEIPLAQHEQSITYRVNGGGPMKFLVAGAGDNLRWAGHSCNGFSAGVDTDSFKGEGFESGFDPVWEDLLEKHQKVGLHAIVGGGDQIYCDSLTV